MHRTRPGPRITPIPSSSGFSTPPYPNSRIMRHLPPRLPNYLHTHRLMVLPFRPQSRTDRRSKTRADYPHRPRPLPQPPPRTVSPQSLNQMPRERNRLGLAKSERAPKGSRWTKIPLPIPMRRRPLGVVQIFPFILRSRLVGRSLHSPPDCEPPFQLYPRSPSVPFRVLTIAGALFPPSLTPIRSLISFPFLQSGSMYALQEAEGEGFRRHVVAGQRQLM